MDLQFGRDRIPDPYRHLLAKVLIQILYRIIARFCQIHISLYADLFQISSKYISDVLRRIKSALQLLLDHILSEEDRMEI